MLPVGPVEFCPTADLYVNKNIYVGRLSVGRGSAELCYKMSTHFWSEPSRAGPIFDKSGENYDVRSNENHSKHWIFL